MKTENEIREYLAECKKTIKDYDEWDSSKGAYCPTSETDYDICKGIVEGLEFALSDIPIVNEEEQSKLNKIADFVLHQNYPKSANGIYAHSEAWDIDYEINEDGDDSEVIVFDIVYGQKDDCHNTAQTLEAIKVRRDVLNEWDGYGIPQLEED